MIKRALVTDGKESTTLAVVQSLGKAGIEMIVGDDSSLAPSRFSRYCTRFFKYVSPEVSASNFRKKLFEQLERHRPDMLFLTSDTQMPVIMNDWEELSKWTKIASPPPETLVQVFDKSKTLALSKSLGVPTPETVHLQSWEDFNRLKAPSRFPVVIKYTQTYYEDGDKLITTPRTAYAFHEEELRAKLSTVNFKKESVLLQEFIPGPGIGVFGIFQNGKAHLLFSHERLREANPTGAASAESKSIPITAEAKKMACALMDALRWTGAAMIELKTDRRTGELKLMEINGRFWGSLPLALRSGIDFPVLTAILFETGTPPVQIDYPIGIRARHLNRYLTHLVHVMKGKPKGWPSNYPGRLATWLDFLKIRQKGLFYYGFELRDPLPAIVDFFFWIYANGMKLFRRLRLA